MQVRLTIINYGYMFITKLGKDFRDGTTAQ